MLFIFMGKMHAAYARCPKRLPAVVDCLLSIQAGQRKRRQVSCEGIARIEHERNRIGGECPGIETIVPEMPNGASV